MPKLGITVIPLCPYTLVGYEAQGFCTPQCQDIHHKKRIELTCCGCSKKFPLLPYLRRNTNYCSVKCYWNSNRRTMSRICKYCKKSFDAPKSLIDKGFGFYCSRKCHHKTYPDRIIKNCYLCRKVISVPPSKQNLVKFCSKRCKDNSERDYIQCICKKCNCKFEIPRSDLNRGRGIFCTWHCFITFKGESSLEMKVKEYLEKMGCNYKQEVKFGRFHADFVLGEKKLVIECDGEFWHMRPEIIERDKRKEIVLKNKGYRVLRLNGQQIKKLTVSKIRYLISQY